MLAIQTLEDRRDRFKQQHQNLHTQLNVVIAPNMPCSLYKLNPVAYPHMTDDRWKPFEDHPGKVDSVVVDKLMGSERFFDRCRKTFESNEKSIRGRLFPIVNDVEDYLYAVNVWLTIVDHFGLEVEYRRDFVLMMNDVAGDIFLGAYRKPGDKSAIALRTFHGQDYTRQGFVGMFDDFLAKYGM